MREMVDEQWRPVIGFPPTKRAAYEVSSLGRIRNIKKDGRVLKTWLDEHGYPRVGLHGRTFRHVHRLVAAAFLGPCPPGKQVGHKNSKPGDSRPDNLEYVTCSENHLHAYRTNNKPRQSGSRHGMAKLTEADVLAIRGMSTAGIPDALIADDYNVCRATITMIRTRRTWRHI